MPAVLTPLFVGIGLTTVEATIASTVVTLGLSYVAQKLLTHTPKPDAAETETKKSIPARVHVLGERRVHGSSMLFVNTTDSETVDVWAYCEGPIEAVGQVYLNDDKATISGGYVQALSDGSYGDDAVLAGYNSGADPETAFSEVVSRVSSWDSDHRGDGIVAGYLIKTGVKAKKFLDIYPQGDNVEMSLVIQGHPCHDPREPASDPDDPSTWIYTENPVLHLLWFKMVFMGKDYATRIEPVEDYWITAADICEESQSLNAGGTEDRYRSCVMFAADANPADIENEILATFDGWTNEDSNGCIRVYAGKLYAPTTSIDSSQIIDYELQEFVLDEDTINEVLPHYISADHDYNDVEADAWRDEADITERGKTVTAPLDIQVPSPTQARRLAKRKMLREDSPQRGTVHVTYSARDALDERFIDLEIEEAGETFFSGTVEITGGSRDHKTGGAIIEWIAVDDTMDDWTPATDDGTDPPTQTKVYVTPPTAPTITDAMLYIADDSGPEVPGTRVLLTVSAPDRTDLTWYMQWRVHGTTDWNEATYSEIGSGTSIQILSGFVPTNAMIDVEVRYETGFGAFSPWSDIETIDTTVVPIVYVGDPVIYGGEPVIKDI